MTPNRTFRKSSAEHVFTFGPDQHSIPGAYVLIKGCNAEQARDIMFAVHGRDWSMQYDAVVADRVTQDKRYNLVQVIEVGGEWTED
jgi:hypothetical protein